ncbi:MAG: hypothetical protein JWR26_3920 [Pedosphaera sp.]|nr:hypothetical protein [Pedosphaera sp.]
MTFLPIVARELRVASRRRATYWSRCLVVVATILLGLIVYIDSHQRPPHELGQTLFYVISGLAFIYCLTTGIRSTADCLSEEKREGTLGLLFLTDLKGYDVVGGKLVATSLNAFYGLLAILPVLAIPLLMGGVTNGEFWRMALVLANTFFFSLAVGMFMSSISTYPRKAMAGTFILLLFFSVGLLLCQAWIPFINHHHLSALAFELFKPSCSFGLVGDIDYLKGMSNFWWSAGSIHALGWLFLGVASVIVPRSWQDNPSGTKAVRWRGFWHRWSYGDPAERAVFRQRLLDINAFFWLAGRARLKPVHVWLTLAILACFWIWGAVEHGSDWLSAPTYVLTAIILNTILKLWIASESGRRLGEDRRIGALELLLSTPLTVSDILRGQVLALKRQFFPPLVTVICVECIFLLASLHGKSADIDSVPAYVASWVAGIIMLAADVLALVSVGMWVSLTAKNPNRATGVTIVRVLILPLGLWGALLVFATLFEPTLFSGSETGWKLTLGSWFGLGIAADLVFGISSWRRLQTEFREVAAHRFAPSSSFWARIFGVKNPPTPDAPPVVAS